LDISHVGAFLSGVAAVLSSVWALRSARKRYEAACLERIEEVKQAIREGYELRDRE
jgi:hypothetical protein